MVIDEGTGVVEWGYAFGQTTVYTIRARATNVIGSYDVTWTVEVPLSYTASVTQTAPSGVIPFPQNIRITGSIQFASGASPRFVPIDIKVTSVASSRETVLSALSNPLMLNTFEATYHPRADDVGNFSVVRKLISCA